MDARAFRIERRRLGVRQEELAAELTANGAPTSKQAVCHTERHAAEVPDEWLDHCREIIRRRLAEPVTSDAS